MNQPETLEVNPAPRRFNANRGVADPRFDESPVPVRESVDRLAAALRDARDLLAEHLPDLMAPSWTTDSDRTERFRELQRRMLRVLALTHDADPAGKLEGSLFFRRAQLVERYEAALIKMEASDEISSDPVSAYVRTAERLLDAIALATLHRGGELLRARESRRRRLEQSLTVRRAFAGLRQGLQLSAQRERVAERLRYAAAGLAELMGSNAYRWLRSGDKEILQALQRRIRTVLIAGPEGTSGIALHEDVIAVGAILREVNHREELRIHDAEVRGKLPSEVPTEQGAAFRAAVASLYGLVEDVDARLDAGVPLTARSYESLLAALDFSSCS